MDVRKKRNLLLSVIISALWASVVLFWSGKIDSGQGDISGLYIGIKLTSIFASCGAAIIFILRLFRLVDPARGLVYSLLAVANTLLGIGGICFYLLHKINVIGLHDLLLNLLAGIILLVDILFLEIILDKH